MHWLPTQERKYLPLGSYPDNLTIRLSNAKNNTAPGQAWTHWSTVVDKGYHSCPASISRQQVWDLSRLLVQRRKTCHIPQTLTLAMVATGPSRPSVIDEIHDQWCRDNGYSGKPQAPSNPSLKPQAKLQAPRPTKPQAASRKHNPKPQALASRTLEKVSETSDRGL